MNHYYLGNSKERITISEKEFASGGEGSLHKILSKGYAQYVAKLYHPPKRTPKRGEKIQYLLENPPLGVENGAVVWIIDSLYDNKNNFVGFIMPFVKGKKLEVLCLGKLSRRIGPSWQRFDFKSKKALQYRMRICFNLAAAIYQVHATDSYVLVDMKPDNIIVQPNGLLAIVDMDSVEVIDQDGVAIYPAPVATPEYTPPEFYRGKIGHTVSESWDRFGMAVIFYKLLFGIHPFAATAHPPYDGLVSLHEKIEVGLFVHHPDADRLLRVIPPPHQKFFTVSAELQALFMQCFVEGHHNPEIRPTANEWCEALLEAIGDPKLVEHFSHIFSLGAGADRKKYKLPSNLLKIHASQIFPQKWIEEQIKETTEIPVLSPAIRQLSSVPKQNIEVKLKTSDYISSFALVAILAFIAFQAITGFGQWLMGDFWLSSLWIINSVFLMAILLPSYVFPRLFSFIRHWVSPERRVIKVWSQFAKIYPVLQKNAGELKKELQREFSDLKVNTNSNDRIINPIKVYLKGEDKEVELLLAERKRMYEVISQKYMLLAQKNILLQSAKGGTTTAMLRNMGTVKQSILKKMKIKDTEEFKNTNEFKKIIKEELRAVAALKKEEEEELKKYKEKLKSIDDIRIFAKNYAKSNSILIRFFRKNAIFDFTDLKDVSYTGDRLKIKFEHKLNIVINKSVHHDLGTLYHALADLLPVIKFLENKKFKNHPVQQIMEPKLVAIRKKYTEKKAVAINEFVVDKAKGIDGSLEEAQQLLNDLIAEETAEKELLEMKYLENYTIIYERAAERMKKTIVDMDKENEKFKIAVNDILGNSKIAEKKTILKQQIEKVKGDIVLLEKLQK